MIARLATLTPQQVRVLMMLSGGLLNKQIAYELGVSEATVKAHVSAILQKLGVESRTQAVIAAGKIEAGQWPHRAGARGLTRLLRRDALHPPLRDQRAQRRRLDRLVEEMRAFGAGFLAHMQRAVGGDQDRRDDDGRGAGAVRRSPQRRCRRRDGSRPEGRRVRAPLASIAASASARSAALSDAAAPAAKQRLHAVENGALVVDAEHDRSVEPSGVEPRQCAQLRRAGNAASRAALRPRSANRGRQWISARPRSRARARCARRSTGQARRRAPPARPDRAGGIP